MQLRLEKGKEKKKCDDGNVVFNWTRVLLCFAVFRCVLLCVAVLHISEDLFSSSFLLFSDTLFSFFSHPLPLFLLPTNKQNQHASNCSQSSLVTALGCTTFLGDSKRNEKIE